MRLNWTFVGLLAGTCLTGAQSGCGVDQRIAPVDTSSVAPSSEETSGVKGRAGSDADPPGTVLSLEDLIKRTSFVLADVRLSSGERVHLVVEEGKVVRFESDDQLPQGDYFEAGDFFAVPAFVDSHVHLSYFPVADALARSGVLAAVDLAAPIDSLDEPATFLELLSSGPMITSLKGYPTQSWGRDGYGLEIEEASAARQAVERLLKKGARVIKVPLDGENSLRDDEVAAVVKAAHAAGVKVAVHALSEQAAARAGTLGCDLLAHTPTEKLSDNTIAAWGGRAVVSTLGAFGRGNTAVSNLSRLHAAGATVLYGTDLGNSRRVGIDVAELLLLEQAGLTRSEALAAGTSVPANYWKLEKGQLKIGGEASFLLVNANPALDLDALLEPAHVFFEGRLLAK